MPKFFPPNLADLSDLSDLSDPSPLPSSLPTTRSAGPRGARGFADASGSLERSGRGELYRDHSTRGEGAGNEVGVRGLNRDGFTLGAIARQTIGKP